MRNSNYHIRNKDQSVNPLGFFQKPRLRTAAVLHNIRSAYNVGNIFRTADAALVSKIYICGYTPCPSNEKVAKTALGAENFVPWVYYNDTLQAIENLRAEGYQIAALETAEESSCFYATEFPLKTAFIFGNEKDGISAEILAEADIITEFPALGMKNSLNVANVFAITVYECLRRTELYKK